MRATVWFQFASLFHHRYAGSSCCSNLVMLTSSLVHSLPKWLAIIVSNHLDGGVSQSLFGVPRDPSHCSFCTSIVLSPDDVSGPSVSGIPQVVCWVTKTRYLSHVRSAKSSSMLNSQIILKEYIALAPCAWSLATYMRQQCQPTSPLGNKAQGEQFSRIGLLGGRSPSDGL